MQSPTRHLRRNRSPRPVASDGLMTLSQLASVAGETVHAVRYYARIALIEPAAIGANGYRVFDQRTLAHLRFIRRAQGLGFKLDEISGFIGDAKRGGSPCPQVRDILERRLPKIAVQLAEMVDLHERMTQAAQRWRQDPDVTPTGNEICRLIESEHDK